jgi:excisionase family DNA binding protein
LHALEKRHGAVRDEQEHERRDEENRSPQNRELSGCTIPAAPPPDPASDVVSIDEAAAELDVSTATIRRWLKEGSLPAEQVTPHAPWRIRLTDEVRRRFVPEVPEGYVPLAEAAKLFGVARQTVLHQVQRGERRAIQVTKGLWKASHCD